MLVTKNTNKINYNYGFELKQLIYWNVENYQLCVHTYNENRIDS